MTTAAAAPATLERYLRRATAGLPPAKRQEVWDELEEHVYARAEQLEWQGASPEQALSRALAELGPPLRVSAGMNGVHNMPKMIAFGTAAALMLSASFYAWAGGREQTLTLPVLTERPVTPTCVRGTKPSGPGITIVSEKGGVTCYTFDDKRAYQGAFLSFSAMKQTVRAQGGRIEELPSGEIRIITAQGDKTRVPSLFTAQGERYTFAGAFANDLIQRREVPVTLSGYAQPTVRVGDLSLQFGTENQNIGEAFYRSLGLELVSLIVHGDAEENYSISAGSGGGTQTHRLQTTLPAGEAVLIFTKRAGENYDSEVVPVSPDGLVAFKSVHPKLRFVTDPAQLGPDPSGGRINALLVRVTNIPLSNLKSGIFVPAQSTSDAP